MKDTDTIAAISTPLMTGAVGIVRISGAKSAKILDSRFHAFSGIRPPTYEPGKLYYGSFDAGEFSDRCLAVLFRAPKSYTGEDMAEIQCHGGVEVVRGVLKAVLSSGARLASPGEFTRRAFLNGKQDLSSCEGIGDMIAAESAAELAAAGRLARGDLAKAVSRMQDSLTDLISEAEVLLDYPEEDLPEKRVSEFRAPLESLHAELCDLTAGYATGRKLKEGVTAVLCGRANAGKSSLFNALLAFDRAIVTDIPGTTRDTVDGMFECKGVKVRLVDTAGVREAGDEIERQGILRSLEELENADLAILVCDERGLSAEDETLLSRAKGETLLVRSKCDLGGEIPSGAFPVSARTGENVEKLKSEIVARTIREIPSGLILTNERHYDALARAQGLAESALSGLEQKPFDALCLELRELWDALGEITGRTATEDIIDNIFKKFCLGK